MHSLYLHYSDTRAYITDSEPWTCHRPRVPVYIYSERHNTRRWSALAYLMTKLTRCICTRCTYKYVYTSDGEDFEKFLDADELTSGRTLFTVLPLPRGTIYLPSSRARARGVYSHLLLRHRPAPSRKFHFRPSVRLSSIIYLYIYTCVIVDCFVLLRARKKKYT